MHLLARFILIFILSGNFRTHGRNEPAVLMKDPTHPTGPSEGPLEETSAAFTPAKSGEAVVESQTHLSETTHKLSPRQELQHNRSDTQAAGSTHQNNTSNYTAEPSSGEDYLNPFLHTPRYAGKTVCRSTATFKDIPIPWHVTSEGLRDNCTLIYGNLVLSNIHEGDDLTILNSIEEVSGYLVIFNVSRPALLLPRLQIIHGQEYITISQRRISLLVANNYRHIITDAVVTDNQDRCSHQYLKLFGRIKLLQTLDLPEFRSVVHHDVYFFENPGLCYAPFTINWSDLIESMETQKVELHSTQNLTAWRRYCHCLRLQLVEHKQEGEPVGGFAMVRRNSSTVQPIAATQSIPTSASPIGIGPLGLESSRVSNGEIHPSDSVTFSLASSTGGSTTVATHPLSHTSVELSPSPEPLHDWSSIEESEETDTDYNVTSLPCHDTCPLTDGKRYCWGPQTTQCQTVNKCQIRLCDGSNRCYRTEQGQKSREATPTGSRRDRLPGHPDGEHCCHTECAAGCTGHRASQCLACLRFSLNGTCTAACPPTKLYDKATFAWKKNPDAAFTAGFRCVKSCPVNLLRDGDHCVSKCLRHGTHAHQGSCVPCKNNVCPRVCSEQDIGRIPGVDYLYRSSVRAMHNCTTFDGDVKLIKPSFVGDPYYNLTEAAEGIRWEDLVFGLVNLKRITGKLYISTVNVAPWMTNLTFLRNLESVDGDPRTVHHTKRWTININNNADLQFLGLTSLTMIGHRNILITANPNLCLVNTMNWTDFASKLIIPSVHLSMNGKGMPYEGSEQLLHIRRMKIMHFKTPNAEKNQILILQNADPEFCRGRRIACSSHCEQAYGCWGPGPSFCRVCKQWTAMETEGPGKVCVPSCSTLPGYYTPLTNGASTRNRRSIESAVGVEQVNGSADTPLVDHVYTLTPQPVTSTAASAAIESPQPAPPMISPLPDFQNDATVGNGVQTVGEHDGGADPLSTLRLQCGLCSPTCRPELNACHGPGDDQCIGPCRWAQDGPFCKHHCPPDKYLNSSDLKCYPCASACSELFQAPPVPFDATSEDLQRPPTLASRCTGPGTWLGQGGCNYCRTTVIRRQQSQTSKHFLACTESCPMGTFRHLINLLSRGGSSSHSYLHYRTNQGPVDRQSPKVAHKDALFPSWSSGDNSGDRWHNSSRTSWSAIDAALFSYLSLAEGTDWLANHTHHGMATICLSCHQQCALTSDSSFEGEAGEEPPTACSGPSPEQCRWCANARYKDRCLPICPPGTYGHEVSSTGLRKNETSVNSASASELRWLECLPCHTECVLGCRGSTQNDCHRCRRFKLYLNPEFTRWRCLRTCPLNVAHVVPDARTGDRICSTYPDAVRIPAFSNLTDWLDHSDTNRSDGDWLVPYSYQWHKPLDAETAGLLAAFSGLSVILLFLTCMIAWAVRRNRQIRGTVSSHNEWKCKYSHGRPAAAVLVTDLCQRLWSQGRPVPQAQHQTAELTRKSRKKIALLENLDKFQSSVYSADQGRRMLQDAHESGRDQCFPAKQPNMATLRIITESELLRGPMIGTGAFGTVFCGLWRPQLTDNKNANTTTTTITINTTNNNNNCSSPSAGSVTYLTRLSSCSSDTGWTERMEIMSDQPLLSSDELANRRKRPPACLIAPMKSEHHPGTPLSLPVEIPVAIKVLTDTASDIQTNKELLEEAKVMATVNHPCCVRFLALCLTSRLQLVSQFMPLGSLLDYLKGWGCELVQADTLMLWSLQIADGMAYLASRGIIHRDLAARNVLVESNDQVKITDFGLAKCLDNIGSEYQATGGRMPIKWLAIECIQDRRFSTKSDVWSYGITLWEMYTFGQRPFENVRARDLLKQLENGLRLRQPPTVSLEFYHIMLSCWKQDPSMRPTFLELGAKLAVINANLSCHLFITPEVRHIQSHNLKSTSSDALEFLSNAMTQTTNNTDNSNATGELNRRSTSLRYRLAREADAVATGTTEYAQMQLDWLRCLYVNTSRMSRRAFPKCVKTLLDHSTTYLNDRAGPMHTDESWMKAAYCTLTIYPKSSRPADAMPLTMGTTNPQYIERCDEGKPSQIHENASITQQFGLQTSTTKWHTMEAPPGRNRNQMRQNRRALHVEIPVSNDVLEPIAEVGGWGAQ